MADLTRGGFIKKTSAGAATLGALAVAPGLVTAAQAAPEAHAASASSESLVAHVRNVATGEIALLVGTREIVIHDHALVRRLIKAAR